jgi:hypothetical protein
VSSTLSDSGFETTERISVEFGVPSPSQYQILPKSDQ